MAKKITLTKSLIGRKKDQIATALSLGLKKVGDVTVQPDNAQTRRFLTSLRLMKRKRQGGASL